jgi:hypothetical protein
LSGKADPSLVKALKQYRNNIVLALSGNLDNPNDFPASELRKSVLTCAYDHLIKESSGLVCRMPISANIFMPSDRSSEMSPALDILPQGLAEYTRAPICIWRSFRITARSLGTTDVIESRSRSFKSTDFFIYKRRATNLY